MEIKIPKGMIDSFKIACQQKHFILIEKSSREGVGAYTLFHIRHRNPNNQITPADLFWLGVQMQVNYSQE